MVDKYLKSNWLIFISLIFIISRIIMYYQFNLANTLLLHDNGTFSSVMCKWDCKWYLTIINDGYDYSIRTHPKIWKGLANWAFFPLYPNLVKILAKSIHLSPVLAGICLNQFFIYIASIFFYKLLRLNFTELDSRFGAVILIFSPFSVYFASLYTEALFIVLSLAGFYYLKTCREMQASILGGLLSATRPVGIMFLVPLIVNFLRERKSLTKLVWCLFVASIGLLIYMLFLKYRAGDFLAFQHIQKAWGRRGWDVAHLGKQLWQMFIVDYHNSTLFLISCLLSGYLLVRKFYEEALFNLACILPGVLTGTMMSEGRFSGTLFTFYFALVVVAEKSWSIKILILIISVVLYLSYYIYWIGHANFLI
jgi:Gpi18-like mannosyltransferase